MNEINPYQSPEAEEPQDDFESTVPAVVSTGTSRAITTDGTILPRHIAAMMDNLIAMILGVMAAKSIENDLPVTQVLFFVAAYLGYYFLFEGFIARTPAKLLTGLVVIQANGDPCTWRHTLIRTCFRVLEVNPLIGGLPAAVCILFSRKRQRMGDMVARTIVIPSRRLPKNR